MSRSYRYRSWVSPFVAARLERDAREDEVAMTQAAERHGRVLITMGRDRQKWSRKDRIRGYQIKEGVWS